ncbi:MAG: copper resistance protein B [Alphaproteobacteria bacterium]|nr:copper resistance protein B [Alphaproteobacteria bacterium]
MRTPAAFLLLFLVLSARAALAQPDGWDAAKEYYDPEAMKEAKRVVRAEHGGHPLWFLQAERLEYRSNEGSGLLFWDAEGWYGGDIHKLWVKTEGEYRFEADELEGAEVQVLYSRAIAPYFDLQAGLRYDFRPDPSKTYGVLGIEGLAPYWFEIDAAMFVSEDGDVSANLEAEYEILLTQRLILQPRIEFNFAVQDVREIGVGSGLSEVEAGLRLRYEIERKAAPYIGVSWNRKVGDTADFARDEGEDVESVSFVAGFQLWF